MKERRERGEVVKGGGGEWEEGQEGGKETGKDTWSTVSG